MSTPYGAWVVREGFLGEENHRGKNWAGGARGQGSRGEGREGRKLMQVVERVREVGAGQGCGVLGLSKGILTLW